MHRLPRFALLAIAGVWTSTAEARPPEIRNIDLRGLQVGAATVVTIDGVDLLPTPRVFLNERPVEAAVDPKSTPTRAVLTVTLPADTASGIGTLRLATTDGFSNGVAVGLDRLPQAAIAAETKALPASLHGSVPGAGISKTTFPGKAGEEVLVEVEAKRLGSKLRPVVHVYDAKRTQVAWALPSNTLAGDSRAVAKLPADGIYTVELHDAQYGAPGPSYFRLKIGRWEFADLVFPPAVARGQETVLQLVGKVPTGTATFRSGGEELLAPVPMSGEASGPPPAVAVSSIPEVLAVPQPENAPQPLAGVPVAVSGRLSLAGQRGRFLLPVQPGMKLAFEVFSERIGSRVDPFLELKNKQGGVLASNDDLPAIPGLTSTTDSRLEFTVPDGLDAIEVSVRDMLETANDAAIYRLVVTSAETPTADFDAVVKSDVANVPVGENAVFEVFVRRENYDGPITLQVPDLPPGVTLQGTEIPAKSSGTLLTFVNAGPGPAANAGQMVTRIRASSADGKIVRLVRFESTPDDRTPVWLRERIALAATPKNDASFTVAWSEATPPTQMVLTTKYAGQMTVVRPPATTAASYGPVRLTLLVSQNPPRVNGQVNLAFNIRQERPIELPVAPAVKAAGDVYVAVEKQHADAVTKAAAAQGDAKVAADKVVQDLVPKKDAAAAALKDAESKAIYTTDFPILLVATTTDAMCDFSVRAELLSTDRTQVLRTTYAPVRRLPIVNPLVLKLAQTAPLEATLDAKTGAALKIDGKIERLADYKGAVTVLVTGVPPGVSLPAVAVPADKSDFQLDLRLPPNFAATEIKGVKLTAQGPGDPFAGGQPLKATEVELVVKVTKAAEAK